MVITLSDRPRRALDGAFAPIPWVGVEHQLTLNGLDFNAKESVKAALGGLRRPTGAGDRAAKGSIPSDEVTMKEKLDFHSVGS
tara:strand:- start:206 stop:454 length:249 start_codon:yes stop_codon:yes gene_type:complete